MMYCSPCKNHSSLFLAICLFSKNRDSSTGPRETRLLRGGASRGPSGTASPQVTSLSLPRPPPGTAGGPAAAPRRPGGGAPPKGRRGYPGSAAGRGSAPRLSRRQGPGDGRRRRLSVRPTCKRLHSLRAAPWTVSAESAAPPPRGLVSMLRENQRGFLGRGSSRLRPPRRRLCSRRHPLAAPDPVGAPQRRTGS